VRIGTLIIDTNLLILFVVGITSRKYITIHKRLRHFCEQDFDILTQIVERSEQVCITPNTLTETSNLACYIEEPAKSEILTNLIKIVTSSVEVYIRSSDAVQGDYFIRLGLTDSVILNCLSSETTLLTADMDLFLAALNSGNKAVNFNHIRDKYL